MQKKSDKLPHSFTFVPLIALKSKKEINWSKNDRELWSKETWLALLSWHRTKYLTAATAVGLAVKVLKDYLIGAEIAFKSILRHTDFTYVKYTPKSERQPLIFPRLNAVFQFGSFPNYSDNMDKYKWMENVGREYLDLQCSGKQMSYCLMSSQKHKHIKWFSQNKWSCMSQLRKCKNNDAGLLDG